MRSIIPVTIIAVGALLAADRVVQPTSVSSPQQLVPRGGPIKVLGIPAPDEWIDIESNVVGQPATVYTVPDKHRLTLTSLALSPRFLQNPLDQKNMSMRLLLNGTLLLQMTAKHGSQMNWADAPTTTFSEESGYWSMVAGTVLDAGDILTVERFDDGNTIGGPASPTYSFAVRGFLEKVE